MNSKAWRLCVGMMPISLLSCASVRAGNDYLPIEGCYSVSDCTGKGGSIVRQYRAGSTGIRVALAPLRELAKGDSDCECLERSFWGDVQAASIMETRNGAVWSGGKQVLSSTIREGMHWSTELVGLEGARQCREHRTIERMTEEAVSVTAVNDCGWPSSREVWGLRRGMIEVSVGELCVRRVAPVPCPKDRGWRGGEGTTP